MVAQFQTEDRFKPSSGKSPHLLPTDPSNVCLLEWTLNVLSLVLTPVIASLVIILHSLQLMNVLMLTLEHSFST